MGDKTIFGACGSRKSGKACKFHFSICMEIRLRWLSIKRSEVLLDMRKGGYGRLTTPTSFDVVQ